ncbi:MAG: hypothetical protein ACKOZT_00375 [Cyanobium sp.]
MNVSRGTFEPAPLDPVTVTGQERAGLEPPLAPPASGPMQRALQLVPPLPSRLIPEPAAGAAPADLPAELTPSTRPDPALAAANRLLEQELAEMHEEVAALQDLLEELPAIFERKFQQRLSRVLEERQQLEADNHNLWSRLRALTPGAEVDVRLLRPHGLLPPGGTAKL